MGRRVIRSNVASIINKDGDEDEEESDDGMAVLPRGITLKPSLALLLILQLACSPRVRVVAQGLSASPTLSPAAQIRPAWSRVSRGRRARSASSG